MMFISRIVRPLRGIGLLSALLSACDGDTASPAAIDAAPLAQLPHSEFAELPQRALQVSGVIEGDAMIRGGVLLADGSVALGIARQNRVLLFAPDGALRDSIGRTGSGPGEFRSVSRIFRAGDGIGVFDAIARRVTWIRDGRVLGITVLQPGGDALGVAPQAIGALDLWRAVVLTRFAVDPKPGATHDTLAVGIADSLGHITLTGARVRGTDQYLGDPQDGMRSLGLSPFGRASVFGVCASGVLWSINDTIHVRRLRSDVATAESIVRMALPTTPIDDRRLGTLLLNVTNDGVQLPDPASLRMARAMLTTTELPLLEAMHCAPDGTLTLQRFHDPLTNVDQLIQLTATGTPTRTFTLAATVRLFDITGTSALVATIDSSDALVVRVLTLKR